MNVEQENKVIWTVGHSNHALETFISILDTSSIQLVADIRSLPGSRKYPWFNQDALTNSLRVSGIRYVHFPGLGGRRKPAAGSKNTAWHNKSFMGYADYMEKEEFRTAIQQLERLASTERVAYMCSEAVWWRCHRSLVSDYLKVKGWKVLHIMDKGKIMEHQYTSPARLVSDELSYTGISEEAGTK
jgi:uncharacterized protein (DUF488 family)